MSFLRTLISRRPFHLAQCGQPHKLILIYNSEPDDKVAEALSVRIRDSLRQVHMKVFHTEKIVFSPQVPYTVVITERTLVDGVLQLQHYRPRISEEVHVSNLVERLLTQFGNATRHDALRSSDNLNKNNNDDAKQHEPAGS